MKDKAVTADKNMRALAAKEKDKAVTAAIQEME
jgi:hypothetical protein